MGMHAHFCVFPEAAVAYSLFNALEFCYADVEVVFGEENFAFFGQFFL